MEGFFYPASFPDITISNKKQSSKFPNYFHDISKTNQKLSIWVESTIVSNSAFLIYKKITMIILHTTIRTCKFYLLRARLRLDGGETSKSPIFFMDVGDRLELRGCMTYVTNHHGSYTIIWTSVKISHRCTKNYIKRNDSMKYGIFVLIVLKDTVLSLRECKVYIKYGMIANFWEWVMGGNFCITLLFCITPC